MKSRLVELFVYGAVLLAGLAGGDLLAATCCTSNAGQCGEGFDCCVCCTLEVSCLNCKAQGKVCGSAACSGGEATAICAPAG